MAKIPRGLSDEQMTAGMNEDLTFENGGYQDEKTKKKKILPKKKDDNNMLLDFITPVLAEKLGRQLLELKLALYQEGIVDYRFRVERQGHSIVMTAVETKPKTK